MADTELKPCPFCGKPAIHEFGVKCSNEACPSENRDFQGFCFITEAQWNTRPLEDALRAKLEQAKQAECDYCDVIGVLRRELAQARARIEQLEAQLVEAEKSSRAWQNDNHELQRRIEELRIKELETVDPHIIIKGEMIEYAGEVWIPAKKHSQVVEMDYEKIDHIKAELTRTTNNLNAELDTARARITEMEQANRWIPVGERLPKAGQYVWANLMGLSREAIFTKSKQWINASGDKFPFEAVTHWRELPAPPEQ